MLIHIGKYSIRHFTSCDVDGLFRVLSDAEVMRYVERPFTLEQTAAFIEAQGMSSPPRVYALADAEDRCVGHVIFHPYDETSYEIGWVIGREHWGRGAATAVTAALIEYCRAHGISRCVIEHDPAQTVTAHIAEKLGFFRMKPEGGLDRWCCHVYRTDQ